jgi:hypothetical protein
MYHTFRPGARARGGGGQGEACVCVIGIAPAFPNTTRAVPNITALYISTCKRTAFGNDHHHGGMMVLSDIAESLRQSLSFSG